MQIEDAQREVRQAYLGASVGQFVSAAVWLVSAALATWGSRNTAMLALIVGGVLIFPVTRLLLALLRAPTALSRDNPLNALGMQVAFTVPLAIPLVLAAVRTHAAWFYPGFMIVVGAHYLPFITMYGLRQFAVLAVLLVAGGWLLPVLAPGAFALGGWIGGGVLLAVAAWLLATHLAVPART
jgi:hypothetical protein